MAFKIDNTTVTVIWVVKKPILEDVTTYTVRSRGEVIFVTYRVPTYKVLTFVTVNVTGVVRKVCVVHTVLPTVQRVPTVYVVNGVIVTVGATNRRLTISRTNTTPYTT